MKKCIKIIPFLKITLSVSLLYWLFTNKELSYKNIQLGLSNTTLCVSFLALTLSQLILGSFRTLSLMQLGNSNYSQYKRILSITWASSFIGSIAPSSLFGDVFRVKELMSVDSKTSKDNSLYASVYSKFFSTFGLILILLIANFTSSHSLGKYKHLYTINYLLFTLGIIFYFTRFRFIEILMQLLRKFNIKKNKNFYYQRLENMKNYNHSLFTKKRSFALNIATSFVMQLLNTISFVIIIYSLNPHIPLNFLNLVSIIPFGIFAMLLPLSFFGLGIGNIVFSELLKSLGITNGADVFTIFFALSYLFNMLGVVNFLKILKKKSV